MPINFKQPSYQVGKAVKAQLDNIILQEQPKSRTVIQAGKDTFEHFRQEEIPSLREKGQALADTVMGAIGFVTKSVKSLVPHKPKYKETTTTRIVSEDEIPPEFREELIRKGLLEESPKKVVTKKTAEQLEARHKKLEAKKAPKKVNTIKTPEQIEAKAAKIRRKMDSQK